jgi:hypothetical protein
MKRVTLVVTLLCALTFSACAHGKQPIAFNNLPNSVQQEVLKCFTQDQVQFITIEKEFSHNEYEFVLTNGVQLEFDENAKLLKAESKLGLPEKLINPQIVAYIKAHFPQAIITEYSYDKWEQDVELNNEIDLVFDSKNNFKHIDD